MKNQIFIHDKNYLWHETIEKFDKLYLIYLKKKKSEKLFPLFKKNNFDEIAEKQIKSKSCLLLGVKMRYFQLTTDSHVKPPPESHRHIS